MPTLNFVTNVKIADSKAFALELSKTGASVLGKPEAYISVFVTYNETLTFAGTFDPAFSLRIDSLGNVNPIVNDKYSEEFSKFFQEKLGIPNDRGYITLIDPGRDNMKIHLGLTRSHFLNDNLDIKERRVKSSLPPSEFRFEIVS